MQVFKSSDTGPMLKVEALISNFLPENVMETGTSTPQGTGQKAVSPYQSARQLMNILVQIPEPTYLEPWIWS